MESCGHPRFPLCHSGVRRYAADLLAICVLIPDNFRLVSMLPLQIFKCPNTARPAGLRQVVLLQLTALMLVLAAPAAAWAQAAAEPNTAPGPQPPLTPLLQQLTAREFSQRQQAVTQLQQFAGSVNGLQQLGSALAANPAPEVARRILEVLEHHFSVTDSSTPEICATADILEQAALAKRWDIAETSSQILDRLWTTRVNVAVAELVRLKAPLQPKDPRLLWQEYGPDAAPGFALNPNSNSILRIYIDEHWPESPRAFELLKRLSGMGRFGRISIYSIQGNSLTAEQKSTIKSLFGDTRVQERGRVCLGILQEPFFGEDSGVLIGSVEKNSSADKAGLEGGDLITSMNDQPLQDFDDLVTRLKECQVGQQIRLEVTRSQQRQRLQRMLNPAQLPPEPPPAAPAKREVVVTLQGWYPPDPTEN
ncbi:MAG: PDZ domain-containing protein [Planctomyces sp.]